MDRASGNKQATPSKVTKFECFQAHYLHNFLIVMSLKSRDHCPLVGVDDGGRGRRIPGGDRRGGANVEVTSPGWLIQWRLLNHPHPLHNNSLKRRYIVNCRHFVSISIEVKINLFYTRQSIHEHARVCPGQPGGRGAAY